MTPAPSPASWRCPTGLACEYCHRHISPALRALIIEYSFAKGHRNDDGELAIAPGDESLIVSILSLGTFLGALTAAPVADFFGRRMGIFFSTAIVFNLGVILQTAATSQPLFIAGRFWAGYGVGKFRCSRTPPVALQKNCSSLRQKMALYCQIFGISLLTSMLGLISAQIPLYQSETAPKWIRGTIVGAYQWAITIGLFLAAIGSWPFPFVSWSSKISTNM